MMYQQVFSLILIMLVLNFSIDLPEGLVAFSAPEAWIVLAASVAICLTAIWLQNRFLPLKLAQMSLVVHLELITLFVIAFFVAGIQLHLPAGFRSLTGLSLFGMLLYFFALSFFRYTFENTPQLKWPKTKGQALFLIPFLLPYFALTTLLDLESLFFGDTDDVAMTLAMAAILILSLLFLPYFLQKFWRCTPLPRDALFYRLRAVCERANFKHGGMKIWTVMGDTLTAGIVGLLPRFRYIMFTPKVLNLLAPEHIEAILAHEIGHSKKHHLAHYPVIILGTMVALALFVEIAGPFLESVANPFFIFIPYALILWLYFRYVFGYFSRLFERQADLYGFSLGLSPDQMAGALDHIAIAAGNIHHVPSWHHYGIQERIDTIRKAAVDPSLIKKHDRRVKLSLLTYFVVLILGIIALFWY